MKRLILGLAVLAAAAMQMRAQSLASPAFEVATIKPLGDTITVGGRTVPRGNFGIVHSRSSDPLRGISGNRFTVEFTTLTDLMVDAYHVRRDQISGAPRWATPDGDLYAVNAKAEGEGTLTSDEARQMLQALLADRFQLKLHRETRNLPVYELTVGKNGPKIKEVSEDAKLRNKGVSKDLLPNIISNYLDRPLVDQTGLAGANYQLDWDQTELLEELRQGLKPAPSIFGVVQDQLGLKLEPKNAPVEILRVSYSEPPAPRLAARASARFS